MFIKSRFVRSLWVKLCYMLCKVNELYIFIAGSKLLHDSFLCFPHSLYRGLKCLTLMAFIEEFIINILPMFFNILLLDAFILALLYWRCWHMDAKRCSGS